MNIKQAKQEIINAVAAYLQKDEYGEYLIPSIRQRPLLLMGPPGIGKTQIMDQIASECNINLAAYTITHHTRQSAIGLPFIKEKNYQGNTYSVTEYTMSEIIASVYEKIEQTGISEGILFLDEINCVSETLAPTMLQFLQCKTFGNQKMPEGWIIVTAGNPPEYNKSVRDFDIVTLDRIRKIEVRENLEVWKEYAYKAEIHPAVMAYLELKKENFYRIESTVDGKMFVTARGWEDLSQLLKAYEAIGKTIDREVIGEYLQHWKISKDFAGYLELYRKYKKDYGLERILEGEISKDSLEKIQSAAFDERLSVIGLLMGRLGDYFRMAMQKDMEVTELFELLKTYREMLETDPETGIEKLSEICVDKTDRKRLAGQLGKTEGRVLANVLMRLQEYNSKMNLENSSGIMKMDLVRRYFMEDTDEREKQLDKVTEVLEYAFDFLEKAFGESQEMSVFITELNTNPCSIWFLKERGCDRYYRYNKGLLLDERRQAILSSLEEIE